MLILGLLISVSLSCTWAIPLQNGAIKPTSSRNIDPRVLNGNTASPERFPFQARIDVYGDVTEWTCTGTILSANWVLSAAHCYDEYIVIIVYIVQDDWFSNAYDVIYHENYNRDTLANDIALLNVDIYGFIPTTSMNPRTWDPVLKNINPKQPRKALSSGISLASDELEVGTEVTVIGWGDVGENSQDLRYANLVTIDNSLCDEYYGEGSISDEMVCAVSANDSIIQTPCFGDAGGPLVTDAGGQVVLVGVVSFFGDMGCDKGAPSAYMRVASYREWIRGKIGV